MNNRLLFPGLIVASLVAAITLAPVLASATAGFLDVNKARSELKWEPQVSLQQGLERTVTYFRTVDDR